MIAAGNSEKVFMVGVTRYLVLKEKGDDDPVGCCNLVAEFMILCGVTSLPDRLIKC